MKILGLDLGTKSLGVAITDKTGILASPLTVIKFKFEDYNDALNKLLVIINDNDIKKVILGLPKNMNGSLGFAAERSINFKNMLEKCGIDVELEDERLTTIESINIIHENNENIKNTKNIVDSISASLILESYLKRSKNDSRE